MENEERKPHLENKFRFIQGNMGVSVPSNTHAGTDYIYIIIWSSVECAFL